MCNVAENTCVEGDTANPLADWAVGDEFQWLLADKKKLKNYNFFKFYSVDFEAIEDLANEIRCQK